MDESELTRKAIEELMRDMNEIKAKEAWPPERKKNPLGKPNKRFLGRTLNSVLTHNQRQSDSTHKKCQRKLKELEKRVNYKKYRNHRKEPRRRSDSPQAVSSSSTSEDERRTHKKSKKLKKKRKKKQKTSSSSSSSTSSSSSSSDNASSRNSSRSKRKYHSKDKHKDNNPQLPSDTGLSYYVDPNMAYAAMAYNQMNQLLQQQQQQLVQQQEIVKEEEADGSVDIPSDLTLSCPESESSLNISINTSSAEEDENGILTFNLTSDDEKSKKPEETGLCSDQDDTESIVSHISLESDKSQTEKPIAISEVCLLNTSSSDSELEIVDIYSDNSSNTSVSHNTTDGDVESIQESLNNENEMNESHRIEAREESLNRDNGKIESNPHESDSEPEIVEIYDTLSNATEHNEICDNVTDQYVESTEEYLNKDKEIIESLRDESREESLNKEITESLRVESREEYLNKDKEIIESLREESLNKEITESLRVESREDSLKKDTEINESLSIQLMEESLNEDKEITESLRIESREESLNGDKEIMESLRVESREEYLNEDVMASNENKHKT